MYKICMLIGLPPVYMIENSAKGRKFFHVEIDPVTKTKVYQVKRPKDAKVKFHLNFKLTKIASRLSTKKSYTTDRSL